LFVMLSVIMLNVIMLNVIMLNIIMLNIIMLSVIMLNVIKLNVIMLSVMAPLQLFDNLIKRHHFKKGKCLILIFFSIDKLSHG